MPLLLPGLPRATRRPRPPRSARLRSLATCPGAAAARPPPPPLLPSRPGTRRGRAPGRGLRSPRAALLHTCSRAPRPTLRPERAGGAAAQVRRQLRGPPAGRQVDGAADAGVSSSRAPGAPTAQQAASRAPALSLHIQAAGGRAGSSFLSRGPNRSEPSLTFPAWEAGGRARSERASERRGGERGPPPLPLAAGALCSLKAAAEKWSRTGEAGATRAQPPHSHAQSSGCVS
ncbi:uncharacterized protein DOCK8-AS1-like [Lynx canadensis]|uniref:uncharacterized protein DOCK8-AS1-like n=1 Tax=Lynx canadensis TaxID=61383 RepID=UPI0011B0736C|nr:uncharacterized protein DOCK8-AS1-like [Lynx canadensis]